MHQVQMNKNGRNKKQRLRDQTILRGRNKRTRMGSFTSRGPKRNRSKR